MIGPKIITIVLLAAAAAGADTCGIQRVPVGQPVTVGDPIRVKDRVVRHFRSADFRKLDSTERILFYEYLPFEGYIVYDARDSVQFYVMAAWTEYVSRFAERLTDPDKKYFTPVFAGLNREADSAYIIWKYPTVKDRDRDLRDADKIRNQYWSVDYVLPDGTMDTRFVSFLRSQPQTTAYHFRDRFVAGGSYQRAMMDTGYVLAYLRQELDSALVRTR